MHTSSKMEGSAPINVSIENKKNTGVGIMKWKKVYTGDILIEKIIKVETNENLTTLKKTK